MNSNDENEGSTDIPKENDQPTKVTSVKKMCLACLEPHQSYQVLDFAKYSVLGNLLAAITKSKKEELDQKDEQSNIVQNELEKKVLCQRC